jgi:capsule polysaccharide export protein KpsE/RkpR
MSDPVIPDGDYRLREASRDDAVSFLDILAVVAKRKWLIILLTGIIAVLTLAFLLLTAKLPPDSAWNLLPNKFKPTVKILLQDSTPSSSLSSALNQSGLGALSGLLGGAGVSGTTTTADLAKALLESTTIEDGVIEKFRFIERYRITSNPKTTARSIFETALKTEYNEKSGILEIGFEDIDPVFATDVINDTGARLQDEIKRLTLDKVTEKRKYLETTVEKAEQEAADTARRLIAFQGKYGIYDLSAQNQATVNAVAGFQSQLVAKQMELDLQRKYVPETDTRIVLLKDQIAQLQKQIDEMKSGGADLAPGTVPLNRMAQLSLEFLAIQEDLQTQKAILGVLKPQYETAKLEEMDTSQTFQVIEKAEVPEVRSAPSRSKIAIIATIAGGFLAVLIAFIAEYFQRAANDPVEAEKLAAIRSSLALRKGSRRR